MKIIKPCVNVTPSGYLLTLKKVGGSEGCEIRPLVKLVSVRTELGEVLLLSRTARLSNFKVSILQRKIA